jgi:hypothetical protein
MSDDIRVLARYAWTGEARELGTMWTLTQGRAADHLSSRVASVGLGNCGSP